MDEKGFAMGVGDNGKVLIPVKEVEAFSAEPGNRDWVSVIESISAEGYSLPSFVIFQGQRIGTTWILKELNPLTKVQVSENGWTNREIACNWLEHFHYHTERRRISLYRLLILDGHDSHVSLSFIQKCEEYNIIPLRLPPHSTHLLQPLDLGIFSPLAKAYKKRISDHSVYGAENISKREFLFFFQQARQEAITIRNIESAWRKAGLHPFDPLPILSLLRPKTPPSASLTKDGITTTWEIGPHEASKLEQLFGEIFKGVTPSTRQKITYIKVKALTAIADRQNLQRINNDLVEKHTKQRRNRAKAHCGEAKVLTSAEIIAVREEKEVKDAEKRAAKERYWALNGKVDLARRAWRDGIGRIDLDIFK
jgi:hypothetical protein